MEIAILFWFYKEPAVCTQRLRHLRDRNPGVAIYGLYGGPASERSSFVRALAPHLDDMWTFADEVTDEWKWRNGDRMISAWHAARGTSLDWDAVTLIQWDTLVTAPLPTVLPVLAPGEMLLSGLRPVREVASWWRWTRWPSTRAEFDAFLAHVEARYGPVRDPLCCQFIAGVLPRQFLDRYAGIDDPELGFLEYKVPVYAQVFGIPLVPDTCFRPFWAEEPADRSRDRGDTLMHAWPTPLRWPAVVRESNRPRGRRVFHPYHGIYPFDLRSLSVALAQPRRVRRARNASRTASASSVSRSSENRSSTA